MTLRVCLDCTTGFAVGVRLCPHCGSERHAEQGSAEALGIRASLPVDTEEEDDMPKITRHGGASIAGEEPEAAPPVSEQEGGEDVSAGKDSSTSSEKPPTTPEPSGSGTPKRARKTASRSGKARTGSSSARSTDGGPEDGTSAADGTE